MENLEHIHSFLSLIVKVASKIFDQFKEALHKTSKVFDASVYINKSSPDTPTDLSRNFFSPHLEEMPENVLCDLHFDSFNIRIRVLVNLLSEVFKFYYRMLRFLDADPEVKKYLRRKAKKGGQNGNGNGNKKNGLGFCFRI